MTEEVKSVLETEQMNEVGQDVNIYEQNDDLVAVDDMDMEETPTEKSMRENARKWYGAANAAYINLAGCLHEIRKNKTFRKWGYKSFRDYVEDELGSSVRNAEYLIQVWEYYVIQEGEGKLSLLEKAQHLGVTKLKECIGLINKQNFVEVIPQVENLSVRKVTEMKKEVQIREAAKETASLPEKDAIPVTRDEIEVDSTPVEKHKLGFKLYPEQYKEVSDALELAGSIGNTVCKNQQLMYVAREFLNTVSTSDTKSAKIEASVRFERMHDVNVLVVDSKTKQIIYGDDLPAKLADGDED